MLFVDERIKSLCSYEGEGALREKQLFELKQSQPMSSKIGCDGDFLGKTLGLMFSGGVGSECSCRPSARDGGLIESLINDKDEKKRNLFNKIFNLTFLDCLKHFRGSENVEELEGINNLEDYINDKRKFNDEEYCTIFKYFINNYETIIKEKNQELEIKKKLKLLKVEKNNLIDLIN